MRSFTYPWMTQQPRFLYPKRFRRIRWSCLDKTRYKNCLLAVFFRPFLYRIVGYQLSKFRWVSKFLLLGYICIYHSPQSFAGYDTRSVFKRCTSGFNSDLSFSLTGFLTKAEEPSLLYYFTYRWGEIKWIYGFPIGITFWS